MAPGSREAEVKTSGEDGCDPSAGESVSSPTNTGRRCKRRNAPLTSPDFRDADKDGRMAVTKDELQKGHDLVMPERQQSPELSCVESSGHKRAGTTTAGLSGALTQRL